MSTREILTLQFGHYSNYIGAHFWNIQELSFDYTGTSKAECNHDILYREGQTSTGEITYTPRLVLADLKGSLGSLSTTGGLPDDDSLPMDTINWDTIEKIEEPSPPKNEYLTDINSDNPTTSHEKQYNLEKDVKTWTDYLYSRFHPRTVNIVREFQHGNENECFEISTTGRSLWKSDFGDTFSDNMRRYVEECDSMQGFQVNFDCTDGFAGLALGCVEHLADEYSKPIMAHPIIASHFPDNKALTQEARDKSNQKDSIRLVNIALSLEELSQHASMFVPLCTSDKGWRKPGYPKTFDQVEYNPELYYHSSSLLAAALDTLSLKYRFKTNDYTISDLCADMTGYGRKLAAASLGIPFAMDESKYLIEHLNEATRPLYSTITPSCKLGTDKLFQLITVRGIPESILKAKDSKVQMGLPAYRCGNLKEMFELYFQANNFLSATNVTIAEKPLDLKTPFPRIFSKRLNQYGFISDLDIEDNPSSVPMIAGYHNGTFMADMLEKLHREVGRIKFGKLHKFSEEGLEQDEFKESMDRLSEFKDNYEDDFEL